MAWVTMGALEALGDVAAADLVQRPTQTRAAVDARILPVARDAAEDVFQEDATIRAAATAVLDTITGDSAAFQEALGWRRGTLDPSRSLNDMWRAVDRGAWLLGSSFTNDLPAGIGAVSKLLVVESHGGVGRQWLTPYGGSDRLYTRSMNNSNTTPRGWTPWKRIGVDWDEFEALNTRASSMFHRQETLATETDLDAMRTRASNGIHVIGSSQTYYNLPPRPGNTVGALFNFSSGTGDTWQRVVWRFNGGAYERFQTTGTGAFTDWQKIEIDGSGGDDPDIEGRLRLLEASAPLEAVFTSAGRISTLSEQRAFLTRLDRMFDTVTLTNIGETSRGTQMQSVTIGDPELPALVLMCAQHGDEIAGSEAVLPWLQTLAAAPPTDICVVVLPAVNVDSFTFRRLTPSTTDLNRNWTTRTTAEVQAVTAVLAAHDVVAVLDCHEGGNWTDCQIAKPTAPGVETAVMTASQALYDAVWDGLEDADLPVSEYPGADDVEVARNALALTEELPILVIETPSQLGGTEWDGPEPNPRLYQPSLATRVQMYHAVFDAALGWAQDQV